MVYRFRTELWVHAGDTPWYFVTLPTEQADEIDELTFETKRGFGSVRVIVTIGETTWKTSLFPDSKRESYVLPIKKLVRVRESLTIGAPVDVSLELEQPSLGV